MAITYYWQGSPESPLMPYAGAIEGYYYENGRYKKPPQTTTPFTTTGGTAYTTRLTREQVLALPTLTEVERAVNEGRANVLDITAWEQAHPFAPPAVTPPSTPTGGTPYVPPYEPPYEPPSGQAEPQEVLPFAGAPLAEEEARAFGEEEPLAAYLRRFQLPGYGQTAFQKWQARQFEPTYGTFQASSLLNPEATPVDWNAYLGQPAARGIGGRTQATALFNQALGQTLQEQREFQTGLGGSFNDFLTNVLRGRYAAPVASRISQGIPGLQQQYTAETLDRPESSFLSWLRNKRFF